MAQVPRPRDLSTQELGFRPQYPISWLTAANTGSLFQVQLNPNVGFDTREVQAAIPARTESFSDLPDLWFDFVGGAGEGFNETYSVAYLESQAELAVAEHILPRAKLLIFGGSVVQPVASWWGYRDRLVGPYTAAFPVEDGTGTAYAMALPGPADWTDGLVAFRRTFANGDTLGARRLSQTRSYFAIEMPGNWWLFALDIPPGGAVLDAPQESYFVEVAKNLLPDSRVIIVVARPTWVDSLIWDGASHDALDLFVHEVIRPTSAQIGLYLASDDHNYMRYAARSTTANAITCGGGGAYRTATHRVPEILELPPYSHNRTGTPPERFVLAMRYPDAATSRRMAWSLLTRLPLSNLPYVMLLAVLHAGLMLTIAAPPQTAKFAIPILVITALAAVLMPGQVGSVSDLLQRATSFGIPVRDAGGPQRVLIALHVVAQILLGLNCTWIWSSIPLAKQSGAWPLIWAFVIYAPVVGVIASLLGAIYLILASPYVRAYYLLNYAALGPSRHKCFLRIRVAASGVLTIYPISVGVCTTWRVDPEGAAEDAWMRPHGDEVDAGLIEAPISVSGSS